MKPALAAGAPYEVPRENRRWPSLAMAVAMHAGLLAVLWVGVQWQSSQPVAVEAEVWDMKTEAAAPIAPPAEAQPEEPAAAEPPPPPPPVAPPVETPPAPQPDIALERLKAKVKAEKEKLAEQQRKAEEKRAALEKAERAEQAAAEAKAKADAKAKAETKAAADAKAKADAKSKADAKAKADKELADKNADKLAKAKQAAADQKAADNARRLEMSRLTSAAGSGGAGTAAKSSGPGTDKSYAAAVIAKIKNNIAYYGGADISGNPRAEFKIEQLPTGEIISVKKTKSSGVPAYDTAVENAIAKSSPLPKKKDGTVDRVVDAGFNLKD